MSLAIEPAQTAAGFALLRGQTPESFLPTIIFASTSTAVFLMDS